MIYVIIFVQLCAPDQLQINYCIDDRLKVIYLWVKQLRGLLIVGSLTCIHSSWQCGAMVVKLWFTQRVTALILWILSVILILFVLPPKNMTICKSDALSKVLLI